MQGREREREWVVVVKNNDLATAAHQPSRW